MNEKLTVEQSKFIEGLLHKCSNSKELINKLPKDVLFEYVDDYVLSTINSSEGTATTYFKENFHSESFEDIIILKGYYDCIVSFLVSDKVRKMEPLKVSVSINLVLRHLSLIKQHMIVNLDTKVDRVDLLGMPSKELFATYRTYNKELFNEFYNGFWDVYSYIMSKPEYDQLVLPSKEEEEEEHTNLFNH